MGSNPIAEKRALRVKSVTLKEVFTAYLESHDLKPGTVIDYRNASNQSFSDWLDKPILSITKDMVERRHRSRGQRSKARANNAMRVLRALFNYAAAKYEDADGNSLIKENPVKRLSDTRAWYRVSRRQSVIKNHQLPAWFKAVMDLTSERRGAKADAARTYLLTLLFTGLRKEEAAQLKWKNIDLADRTVTVADTKNRDEHTLPLPDYLHDLLAEEYERRRAGCANTEADDADLQNEYVFSGIGGTRFGANLQRWLPKVRDVSGVSFMLHDLRRTFTTAAESLDISAYALKRLLNHRVSQSDVTAGYIVTDVERLRAPMRKIERHLLRIAQQQPEAKVVSLSRPAH